MIKVARTLNGLTPTEKLLVDKWFNGTPTPVEPYTLITPVDTSKFPLLLRNMKLITFKGTEFWAVADTGCYSDAFMTYFKGVSRTGLHAFSEHWEFDTVTKTATDMSDNTFIFNGISSNPVNGNITFKNSITAQGKTEWKEYLKGTPEHVLIPLNYMYEDRSEWKPARRNSDGATGYWNGADEFIAVYGGIRV